MFDTIGTPGLWAAFTAFVVAALAIDLWVMDRRSSQTVDAKSAIAWSVVWIALALAFGAGLWAYLDGAAGRETRSTPRARRRPRPRPWCRRPPSRRATGN